MRVLRIHHGGRDPSQRPRERALAAAGVDVVLLVPSSWPEPGAQTDAVVEDFTVVALPVERSGDADRHRYSVTSAEIAALLERQRPDLVDIDAEPYSAVTRQWLAAVPYGLPIVGSTAQNLARRHAPPQGKYERAAFRRLGGVYAATRQAASVTWGKGFRGELAVLPAGHDAAVHEPGRQFPGVPAVLLLAGRMDPEKGPEDAVRALEVIVARDRGPVGSDRRARLVLVGEGPHTTVALRLADRLGVADLVQHHRWLPQAALAAELRRAHVVLAPARATSTWAEQRGRVAAQAQAAGAVVVGYASGALPEVVGDAGVPVPDGDVEALAREVSDLLDDPGRWLALRKAGIAQAATRSWDRVGQAQLSFYERVVEGPGAIPPADPDERSWADAVRRFGPPARAAGGVERPFTDPVLRHAGPVQNVAGRALDAVSGVGRKLRRAARGG
ncbi:MAG: glycosyltransferase [Jiangellaceae bacterium]